jgi:hypothetical protein
MTGKENESTGGIDMSEALQLSRSQVPSVPEALTPDDVMAQVHLIQSIMERAMKKDEHYGVIPGTGNKPTLLKAGAEKLNLTFRMAPDPQVEVIDLGKGHREYRVKVVMTSITSGKILGAGVGSASTMETKWRFRTGPGESTGRSVPSDYWDSRKSDPKKAQEILGGKGFITKKEEGVWMIFRQGEKVEHDNPADYYNTCLKMGKKRALVDAVLTCTAASDIFTQDVEELVDNGVIVAASSTVIGTTTSAPVPTTPPTPPPAQAPTDAPPATTPAEKKDDATLLHELQELMAIAKEAGLYPTEVDALHAWTAYKTKDGKDAGYKDVLKLAGWKMKKAIEKGVAELEAQKKSDEEAFG